MNAVRFIAMIIMGVSNVRWMASVSAISKGVYVDCNSWQSSETTLKPQGFVSPFLHIMD